MQDDIIIGGELCELVTLMNQRGLHARAASKFVQVVMQYQVDVQVQKEETIVSGHSIMGLMMLAASRGTRLKICASGPDAPAAIMALSELVQRKFDEE
ncbi:MAG: HPr family phosphocarrier protein [Alphaproteobacteria bacterium]|nr:HPr family phosphocarrier protein [Alphaproteobacteria bacterium]NDC55918.1 HPr family phosphocarrier protein [Alphaproteobacteria bacterium]NDG04338.1 HPr family phosphocarrier protein [Alphaproteobacteria bacterium]